MVSLHRHAPVLALLLNEPSTKPFEHILRSASYTEEEPSPGCRIDTKLPSWPVDKPAARQRSSGESVLNHLLDSHMRQGRLELMASQCGKEYSHHPNTCGTYGHNEQAWEDKENERKQELHR